MVRDSLVMIRLTAEERQALTEAAKREDVPVAQVARRAIKRELARLEAETKKRGRR